MDQEIEYKAEELAFGVVIALGIVLGGLASYLDGKPLRVVAAGGLIALWYAIRLATAPRPRGEGEG